MFKWKPLTKESQGRPMYRWEDNMKQDICQMKIKNWTACVQDREKWKEEGVEKGKTFSTYRKFSAWKKKKKSERSLHNFWHCRCYHAQLLGIVLLLLLDWERTK
jgi:hypothetical protein